MSSIDWSKIASEEALIAIAAEYFDEIGLSSGVLAYTPISHLPSGRPGLLRRALAINLDVAIIKEWFQFQEENATPQQSPLSQSFDPVRIRMSNKLIPEWLVLQDLLDDHLVGNNVVEANWISQVINFGIRESFHIPVFTGRGEYWSLAVFRFSDNPNEGELPEEIIAKLHWMTVNFVDICINRFHWRESKPEYIKHPLSPRELECLYWAAQGHSTQETAEILEIKNETVRQYMKQSLKKLNARNKTQAIWLAHTKGYLSLS